MKKKELLQFVTTQTTLNGNGNGKEKKAIILNKSLKRKDTKSFLSKGSKKTPSKTFVKSKAIVKNTIRSILRKVTLDTDKKKDAMADLTVQVPEQNAQPVQPTPPVTGNEMVVQHNDMDNTKFIVTHQEPTPYQHPQQWEPIPDRYGVSRIVLLVRDPFWVHTYWELTDHRMHSVKSYIDSSRHHALQLVLRIMDVNGTDPNFPNSFYYISLTQEARNWYIRVPNPDCAYCVEIGWLLPTGEFFAIERSNIIKMPRAGMSNIFDERWMSIEDYDRLYVLSGGLGFGLSSAELIRKKEAVMLRESYSGGASEMGIPAVEKQREFFLVADTEIIVYGRTVPGSKLTIGGADKKLNADGTFSMRFNLPEGIHRIPIKAESSDKIDEYTITFTVTREKK